MNRTSALQLSSSKKITSLVLKVIAIVSAILGTVLSAYAGRNAFMGGRTVFMFFTIQSNIALAIISGIGFAFILKNRAFSDSWYLIKFVGTVSITLTGMVFCFVLAPTMGAAAWNFQNILTHVVVPLACVVDFFVTGIESSLRKRDIFFVTIPPIIYAVYAGIGYACNWQFAEGINYPYFFLNWGSPAGAFKFTSEFPFMGCAWWILALLIFLIAVGLLYLWILGLLRRFSALKVSQEKI
ncbi:MAG: Pr6Pr family membrane protein [Treponemataceae bacterium]|nr:Pr6Pr family membrane protein [Treponemataceae bacterium]